MYVGFTKDKEACDKRLCNSLCLENYQSNSAPATNLFFYLWKCVDQILPALLNILIVNTIPVAGRSKTWVCVCSLVRIVGLNPAGGVDVCWLWVLSSRNLCVGLVTRPEESYRLWCVWVWSWILGNEVALAHWGLSCQGKKRQYLWLSVFTAFSQ
jgi:hypothetical protein